jgi:spore coat protein A
MELLQKETPSLKPKRVKTTLPAQESSQVIFVRDQVEDALNLPKGKFEIPLAILDRLFTKDGQLLYPVSTDPGSRWVSAVHGNAILVNGKLFPYLNVELCKYRLRVLNASNGRFCHLSFSNNAEFHQIGTDQGLLSAPVPLNSVCGGSGRTRGSGY